MSEHPAILTENLSYRYPDGGEDVLANITLRVECGEKLGILGPNGGGKSTLLKLVLGLLRPDRGRVLVFGLSPERARVEGLVGYLPQRIEAALDAPLSVRQVIALPATLPLGPLARLGAEARAHIDRILGLLELEALADRPVAALSGGQLQRVMIARALSRRPHLLILDEPTVGIDVRGQQRFAEMLKRLHDELGLTVLLVSHELRTVVAGSDRIACLARTMHFHGSASGLTPHILGQVFRHDVEAMFGPVSGETAASPVGRGQEHGAGSAHDACAEGGGCCGHH
ncbi:MAG: metal ABC transporter ATP-binding protein [Phycisphaerales bacterium]|nr:metal ABC transporter ATP-binding protein [Phycisphaerales bacterium]